VTYTTTRGPGAIRSITGAVSDDWHNGSRKYRLVAIVPKEWKVSTERMESNKGFHGFYRISTRTPPRSLLIVKIKLKC
jgi:hypothetical protein